MISRTKSSRTALRVLLTCAVSLAVMATPAYATFGIAPGSFHAEATDAEGSTYTQAAGHPFEFTTSFELNTKAVGGGVELDGDARDAVVELPPGVVGNPQALPACHSYQVAHLECPVDAQVGVVALHIYLGSYLNQPADIPLYNIVPNEGEPAAFAFNYLGVVLRLDTKVRSNGDYGIDTAINGISEEQDLQKSVVTLWGVPADPGHDAVRCARATAFGCEQLGAASSAPLAPFLTLPSDCASAQSLSLSTDSWQEPGIFQEAGTTMPAVTGCEALTFKPTIDVQPDSSQAGAPSGYTVELKVPQDEEALGLSTPDLREAVVTLPAGVSISPSQADGLGACTDAEIGIGTSDAVACPANSKIGEVSVVTPLLSTPLAGGVYLGTQESNDPSSGKEFRIFLDAENAERGQSIRLEGAITPNPVTGQLTTAFNDNPQLPFSDLTLRLKGGARAALSNPATCGTYTTTTKLTPYGGQEATPTGSFAIDAGCATGAFAPAFSAGTMSSQAGGFSPFTVTFSRSDTEQQVSSLQVRTPAGLLGILKNVPLCGEPLAAKGECSPSSQIGHTTVQSGAGAEPLTLPQAGEPQDPVYLTTAYNGAPYGLSIVVPAKAGPFNLGTVVVRAAISIDPHTAQLTITSDALPTILEGVPLDIRAVNVMIDRGGFMFNPTNCSPLGLGGTIGSTEGASAPVASPFEAVNCATLPFKPVLSASTGGRASKASGASLDVKVLAKGGPQQGGGEANIRSVKVDLPKQLPSRLTTLQKACVNAVFEANPAGCPAASNVGTATVSTPILAQPLRGPAYLVSHGGAAFPDLEIVLQGEGITLILDGKTDIKKGITTSTFSSVPDAPISSFELQLPTGKYSVFAANLPASAKYDFCGRSLTMPTLITGQNGAVVKQSTKLAVAGCPKARKQPKAKKAKKAKRGRRA
jgi:hypothetical protein